MSRFPAQLSVVFFGLTVLVAPLAVMAENVPDALSVEWQGQKPCEKLFEDAQIHIARCTFPSGAMHVCHSHLHQLRTKRRQGTDTGRKGYAAGRA